MNLVKHKDKRILYVKLPSWIIYPGGIIYVADYLHKKIPSIEQKIIDLSFIKQSQQKKYLDKVLEDFNPSHIAFSWRNIQTFAPHEDSPALRYVLKYDHSHIFDKMKSVFAGSSLIVDYRYQTNRYLGFLHHVKKKRPDIKIAIGGTAFTIYPEELIKKCPEGTIGVVGEGEEVFYKFVNNEDILSSDAVINNGGEAIRGKGRNIMNMEELEPVDYHYINSIFDKFTYFAKNDYIGVQTKRGCPYRCLFCLYNRIEGAEQRFKRPEVVAADLENLQNNFGVKNIWFTDAQFCASKKSVEASEKLLDEIIKRNILIRWSGNLRIELADREFARKAIKSGLKELHLTFTGSQKVIDKLKLGYKLDKQLEAMNHFYNESPESKIEFKLYLALNVPGETKETLLETIKVCKDLDEKYRNIVTPYLFLLAIQPNTPLEKHAIEQGYIEKDYDRLTTNPLILKKLLYNPPPLGNLVAKSFIEAMKDSRPGEGIGWKTLGNIEKKLTVN